MIELNDQQAAAALAINFWFTELSKDKQTFVLAGYAGTGKTFLINYVIKEVLQLDEKKVAFVTPTGKAASVLIQRGRKNAMTIHRLIYAVETEEKITTVNGEEVKSKKLKFIKRSSIPNYDLIVLDEISMVEEQVLKDLLSYGIPVLCSGDIAQLPAVLKSNNLLQKPDAQLTEIMRQSADNAIVKIATMAREGKYIPFGNYGDVLVLDRSKLTKESMRKLLLGADQILCGKNATRREINKMVREFKGIDTEKELYPKDGEKVICNVNNWEVYLDEDEEYNLVNGTIGYASNFEELNPSLHIASIDLNPDFLPGITKEKIIIDSGLFKTGEPSYDMHQRCYELLDGSYVLKRFVSKGLDIKDIIEEFKNSNGSVKESQIEQVDFGYCISVHKSQGSEWKNVVLFDESYAFGKDRNKHLYTGITRAKKRLVILR